MNSDHQNVQRQLTSTFRNAKYNLFFQKKLFTKLTISPVVVPCLAEFDNLKLYTINKNNKNKDNKQNVPFDIQVQ
jgi:hypothetical protein